MNATAIRAPAALPILGNLHQIPRGKLMQHLLDVSRAYPEGIFKMLFGSRVSIFVTNPDLVAELCDETRFRKLPGPGLRNVRAFAGDGLFTAFTEEPNWGKAHRILMPAFSQRAMKGYYGLMLEVADALIAKWDGQVGRDVHVADDMTRLTLDTIAIAGFGHRFNSFGQEKLDPFLEAMGSALGEAMEKLMRMKIQQRLAKRQRKQFESDIEEMNALVDGIIQERRRDPNARGDRDLMSLMLEAIDPETGESLDDVNIRYQVLTFLIAGHETTSGMLTFAFALLLRHPHILAQAYAEVDRVLPGDARPEYQHLSRLTVIDRILKEALRLWPTAPAFSVGPFKDEVIGGRYHLRKDRPVNILIPALHRDPSAWENPEEFDIDRFLPEREATMHPHAYKPFGSGARACIGRQFALTEAKLAVAMILQRFAISDPHGYRLKIKETLTLKPDEFTMRLRRRLPHERVAAPAPAEAKAAAPVRRAGSVIGAGQTLTIAYGTSLGTAREIAEELGARGLADGFDTRVVSLDEGVQAIPDDGVLVVVTATYNGRAPDSAVRAERAIDEGRTADLAGLKFAVLGIGNTQWPNYQAFPRRVDEALDALGAERIVARGEANVEGDFDSAVEGWINELWTALGGSADASRDAGLEVSYVDTARARAAVLPPNATALAVLENRELVGDPTGLWDFAQEPPRTSTRHIALALPEGLSYRAGDHVAVYARNRAELVAEAVERLGLEADALLVLESAGGRLKHLPLGRPVTVRQLLTDFVELQDPASRKAVQRLAEHTRCPHTKGQLAELADGRYVEEVADRRASVLDLLARYPAVELPLGVFLELSAAIAPRFYSIASSPLVAPERAELLVGTMVAPAWSGNGQHQGFASSYMRDLRAGDRVLGFVRRPNPPFAPPEEASVPMILVGPGTGFAPLRGFLQERSGQKAAGVAVAESLLFFGCRHPDHDWFYRDEMERWRSEGIARLHLACSAVPSHPWRFVQDALWAEQEEVWKALEAGAQVFVCGDGRYMAPAVRDTLIRIHIQQVGSTHAQGSEWLESLIESGRYHQDVFGFGK